ncbi:hypothetical protein BC834DRAFT_815835 [Gloeopeniophorella convolvens]|nr:hypothetical protein BC834DRAFT_815835 [Gloeopeniophorella convolvens]
MHGLRSWTVRIAQNWDVLGPFPIHAREQHFLSPSFPLDLTEPVDLEASHPSSLADGGLVHWSKASMDHTGRLSVSFPHIRWASLRATEGWAGLQHHAILRTTLTVFPPQHDSQEMHPFPNLLIELKQGSFFALTPADGRGESDPDAIPEWYSGNIYEMDHAPAQLVKFPTVPSTVSPTVYRLYISGDYEIRLFGDPRHVGSETPTLGLAVQAYFESPKVGVVRQVANDVIPEFVEGFAFGDALGIGLRCLRDWWTIKAISLSPKLHESGLALSLVAEIRLAPGQTRVLPVRISQSKPFTDDTLSFDVHADSGGSTVILPVKVDVSQLGHWSSAGVSKAMRASYFSTDTGPMTFMVLSPAEANAPGTRSPPVLALHGAGVDILKHHFWVEAVPRQKHSWIIFPSGRTPWGLDWHGVSSADAWDSVSALAIILGKLAEWNDWMISQEKVVIIGHSNGGQGTWHNAARYPDRVLAVVPAAGYIKAQAYVPLTQSRSSHFMDPSLRSILEASFIPDDNDLFLSNMVDTPALVVHGGADDNVPTWHSRECVSVLKTWRQDAIVKHAHSLNLLIYREDPGQGHWYPSVFRNDEVQAFLDLVLKEGREPRRSSSFTLTTAVPAETGSLHGWRILGTLNPASLARLTVTLCGDHATVDTSNVKSFSIDSTLYQGIKGMTIDGCAHAFPADSSTLVYIRRRSGRWDLTLCARDSPPTPQRSTRPYTALSSRGPILIVVSGDLQSRGMSIALRLAHDLWMYFKLDSEIVSEFDILADRDPVLARGCNVVVIGTPGGLYVRQCLARGTTTFKVADREDGLPVLQLNGESLDGLSQGVVFTHPHETSPSATMLFLIAHDQSGLERAARLFPSRTGLALADWMVIGSLADKQGASGVSKAGLWGCSWEYHSGVSWQH